MSLAPEFVNRSGRKAPDPLTLAGPDPVVDLDALSLLLAPPALFGEFVPRCVWTGVDRVPPDVPAPSTVDLRSTFTAVVDDLTTHAQSIGVLVSGGLDSLAVLVHALYVARGRPVVAFTTDLTDDEGGSAVATVNRVLHALDLRVELVVLDPACERAAPAWSAIGPRLDALPEVNAATAARAAQAGVDVLLSGDGADELLGVPRFATALVAARWGPRAAALYARDVARSGPGLAGELVALTAQMLPDRPRARTYWAANWPEWCDPVASAVLAEPYRSTATTWARKWVHDKIEAHAVARRSWAQADAYDAWFPHDPIRPAGSVPETSPFLHERFLRASLGLPLADRFHPSLPSAYLRCKSQVVRLLPREAVPTLPLTKQYFTAALRAQSAAGRHAPRCVQAGLVDPDALSNENDPAVLLVVAAIESWLVGAGTKVAVASGD